MINPDKTMKLKIDIQTQDANLFIKGRFFV